MLMKDWLEFDNYSIMDEYFHKEKICYQYMKHKWDANKTWSSKKQQKDIKNTKNAKTTSANNLHRNH